MYRLLSITTCLVLCFSMGMMALPVNAYAYEILTPPSKGKVLVNARRAESHLVIKAKDKKEADGLRVGRVLNREGDTEPIKVLGEWEKDGAAYVHYLLELKKGTNQYVVSPGEQELTIRYQPMRTLLQLDPDNPGAYLFHRNDIIPASCNGCHTEKLPPDSGLNVQQLSKNSDFSPVCYSCHKKLTSGDKWLHGPAAAVACMTCHRSDKGKRKVSTLVGRVDEACFTCHINKRKWTENAFVHGPAATGDCTVCHDPHGADFPYMLWADPKMDICIACHTDKKSIKKKQKNFVEHGIIEGNGCSACHSPHASDYRFQLAGSINEVCVSCHIRMRGVEEGHPVGNHPISDVDDPRRKGRELSCSSCHNPHGANYKYLLIGSLLGGHVCSKCHN